MTSLSPPPYPTDALDFAGEKKIIESFRKEVRGKVKVGNFVCFRLGLLY
jgi:hypothetical protein